MPLLVAGQAALVARLKTAAGRAVTYTRGGTSWPLTAWRGQTETVRAPTAQPAATVVRNEADWLFTVADAKAAGVPLPPQVGDRITDPLTVDDTTGAPKVFELQPLLGEKHWRYSDELETTVRVHTKRAGA